MKLHEKLLTHFALAIGALALLLCFHSPAQAHSGSVALAVPLEGITVDGDLSDWPEDMERYDVSIRGYGSRPKNEDDFLGSFRVGYSPSENALYVAAEVEDDAIVLDPGQDLYDRDAGGLSLEIEHLAENVRSPHYWAGGRERGVYGPGNLEHANAEVQSQEGVLRYEWRIDVGAMSGNSVRLAPAMTIGFDLGLSDADPDGPPSFMAWSGRNSLWNSRFLGDLILVGPAPERGRLRGQLRWQSSNAAAGRIYLRLRSQKTPAFWLATMTDPQGRFDLELPAGTYGIETDRRVDTVTVDVRVGQTTEISLEKQPPNGITAEAGKGRLVAVGGGTRKGLWHTLDLADGLPDAAVVSILQDRQGFIWFGTKRGICRYDGAQFRIFTTDDGLLDSGAETIFQDSRGHLWFAGSTLGLDILAYGVTRYDGKHFTHFTQLDGLISDNVTDIIEDRRGNLWFATQGGVSQFDGHKFTNFTPEDGLVDDDATGIVEDRLGNLWFATQGGVSRFDGHKFTNFTSEDGLIDDRVISICEDDRGNLWFGTWGNGASRYDGERFTTFTTEDGLANNAVLAIEKDDEGNLWFGTDVGVSRFDGHKFTNFLPKDGLAYDQVWAIEKDGEGNLWFGTGGWSESGGGVSRYDGGQLAVFTREDGLGTNGILSLEEDSRGNLWFGGWGNGPPTRYDGQRLQQVEGMGNRQTWAIREDKMGHIWFGTFPDLFSFDGDKFIQGPSFNALGIGRVKSTFRDSRGDLWFIDWDGKTCRYDGAEFRNFTSEDGLPDAKVNDMAEDGEGRLWFATESGATRYDARQELSAAFTTFTIADGLPDNAVEAVAAAPDGSLWFGTKGGFLCRYDGAKFTAAVAAENVGDASFSHNMLVDRRGNLWYTVYGGGLTRYDGRVFQRLLKRDGITHDAVQEILQARNGDIWIATEGGVTRYRDRRTAPPVEITDVIANRAYGSIADLSIPTTQTYLSFHFKGRSFKTRSGQMVYLYRLQGRDSDWRQTREEKVVYADLPRGEFLFQVQAVDRDLNYSEHSAEVRVSVHLPYERLALMTGLGLALVGFVAASAYGLKRRRDLRRAEQALMRELEEELQTAHDMQMSLMPNESPNVKGFDIAGRCLTANHVGGDFFQYFQNDGKLSICLADVTGHAMEAAIPVVMFNGILESQMEQGGSLEDLFFRLNRSLHRTRVDGRTFVCFSMAEIDRTRHTLRLTNGGCPYPYHYSAAIGEVAELQIDAYPLGVRPDTAYPTIELSLESGDYLVFCSDGIPEAAGPNEEIFGFERTAETIRRGCAEGLFAEGLITRLLDEVGTFTGTATQEDDMTVVVLQVEA